MEEQFGVAITIAYKYQEEQRRVEVGEERKVAAAGFVLDPLDTVSFCEPCLSSCTDGLVRAKSMG